MPEIEPYYLSNSMSLCSCSDLEFSCSGVFLPGSIVSARAPVFLPLQFFTAVFMSKNVEIASKMEVRIVSKMCDLRSSQLPHGFFYISLHDHYFRLFRTF